jgi:YVTN family beta-propeller protein
MARQVPSVRRPHVAATPAAWVLALAALTGCNATANRTSSRALDAEPVSGNGAAVSFPVKDASQLNVVATVDSVSGDWMCVGLGSLWVPSGGSLVRIDPAQHAVTAKIHAPGNFCYASPSGNQMWVASVFDGKLYRIDATTNQVTGTYSVPITSGSEGSFAVTDGGVWVVTSDGGTNSGTLTRVDPTSGQVVADVRVADDSHGIAAQGGYVWVTSYSGNSVTQVDAQSNAVINTISVDPGPRFIAGGENGVWALSQGTGTVAHIDPSSGTVLAEINANTPGGGGDIAAGEGSVWVATFGKPVTRINPTTNTVVEQFTGGDFGDAVRAGAGYVWVSGGHISQIQPSPLPGS